MRQAISKLRFIIPSVALLLALGGVASAANTPTFNQTISAGALTTDITDGTTPVASPSVAMTARNQTFTCQTSTGTFGTASERIYVSNPGATTIWTLSIAATAGATAVWTSAGPNYYDFNDANASGCTDGADADAFAGQLTVNANAGTINPDCSGCTTTGITKGASTGFVEGTTNSVTLMNAGGTAQSVWNGYLTGATLSQTIPSQTPVGSYSLPMTLTVVNS